ncbi:unnamed protein product [Clavelina lepadiformis]|uniref:Uncharacterized protein n=1 Tax=Clavelina lepadiformis TaxID=159417 RepID=A0ABP0G4C2_CLALP
MESCTCFASRGHRTHQAILSSTYPSGKRQRRKHSFPPLNLTPQRERELVTYKITVSVEQYRYFNVVFNGKPSFSIVDTSASINVISHLAFQQCSAQDLKDCPSNVQFRWPSGTVIAMAEIEESATEDDLSSLFEQLHPNDLNLSDIERETVVEVIRRRLAAFSLPKRGLGKTNILTHNIDT